MRRRYYHADDLGRHSLSSSTPASQRRWPVEDPARANLVSSEVEQDEISDFLFEGRQMHMPTLDFDFPVEIRESETPGHFHVFLNRELSWPDYVRLLVVMGEIGLLEQGYVNASIERGATFVATKPWKNLDQAKDAVAMAAFGRTRSEAHDDGSCISCRQPVTGFKDDLSRREYGISGLCQTCQDGIFVDEEMF